MTAASLLVAAAAALLWSDPPRQAAPARRVRPRDAERPDRGDLPGMRGAGHVVGGIGAEAGGGTRPGRGGWRHAARLHGVVLRWSVVRHSGRARRHGGAVPIAACAPAAALGPLVSWPCACAAAMAAATAIRLVRRARAAAAARADLAGLADALRGLARDLRAGTPAARAVAHAAESAPPRIATLLGELPGAPPRAASARGSPPSPALAGLWPRMAAGWELSLVHGVPLAAVVSALAADVIDRMQAGEARAAQVAGPAVSGYVLSALPVAGLLLGAGMGTDPLAVLTGSVIGGGLLVAGTLLCCAGLLWADRIVRG